MKVKIIGKELKITEAINDYVEKKLDRIEKYFEESEAEVTLKTEKTDYNAFTPDEQYELGALVNDTKAFAKLLNRVVKQD